jgi:hypothetical protein
LLRKSERNRQLRQNRRRWEDNIKMDIQEVGLGHVLDCSGSVLGQVAGSCECGNEISGSITCGNS